MIVESLVETRDDHALRYIRPKNILRSGANFYSNRERSHITLVFSIKTLGKFVSPPYGLRVKRPFVNRGWNILKVLWWAPLGLTTYREARIKAARYLDQIYSLLNKNAPIVALRATLVDWKRGKPIKPATLRDPWWYDRTFGELELNVSRLRSWGMAVNDGFYTSFEKNDKNGVSVLENKLSFDLESVLQSAIDQTISTIPALLSAKSVMQLKGSLKPLDARRALVKARSSTFFKRLRMYVENLHSTSEEFAEKLTKPQARMSLLAVAKEWVRLEINKSLFR